MFNSINCNGPPNRGIFYYMVLSYYRVDLFVLSDWILRGSTRDPGAYTQSYMDPGTILVSRRVPVTHDNL